MSPDTAPAAPSARDSRGAAAAWSHAIRRPPHARVGPRATARAKPTRQEGPSAITSSRGTLVGYGRINTLLPLGGSGLRANPEGEPTCAKAVASTTSVNPERNQVGVKGEGGVGPGCCGWRLRQLGCWHVRVWVRARCRHGGDRQPMCDPEGCSTVWGAVGGGGGHPPPKGGGASPPLG